MLAVIAKLNVKEGSEQAFEEVMLDLAAKVNANEPGCHVQVVQRCGRQLYRYGALRG